MKTEATKRLLRGDIKMIKFTEEEWLDILDLVTKEDFINGFSKEYTIKQLKKRNAVQGPNYCEECRYMKSIYKWNHCDDWDHLKDVCENPTIKKNGKKTYRGDFLIKLNNPNGFCKKFKKGLGGEDYEN